MPAAKAKISFDASRLKANRGGEAGDCPRFARRPMIPTASKLPVQGVRTYSVPHVDLRPSLRASSTLLSQAGDLTGFARRADAGEGRLAGSAMAAFAGGTVESCLRRGLDAAGPHLCRMRHPASQGRYAGPSV